MRPIQVNRAISMATSATTATVSYHVTALIEQATRRCGLLPGRLSAEETLAAQTELQQMLNSLVNEGIPLWTVNKQIYGLNLNQNVLNFSADTVDLQNVLYRFNNLPSGGIPASSAGGTAANAFDQNLTTACTQTAANGNISYNFTTNTTVVTVGFLPNATGTLNPIYEYSLDGVTWVTSIPAAAQASTFTAGQWYWQDVDNSTIPAQAQYYRIRETSGGTLNVTELVFGTAANEIILSRLNKDDYQNLPFKNQIGRPLQFWYDRQIQPRAWLWPASQYSFNSVVVWAWSLLQDVGLYWNFTNTLQIPIWWEDTILWSLAARLIWILPGADINRATALDAKALQARNIAWVQSKDDSEFTITPLIGAYTHQSYGGSR